MTLLDRVGGQPRKVILTRPSRYYCETVTCTNLAATFKFYNRFNNGRGSFLPFCRWCGERVKILPTGIEFDEARKPPRYYLNSETIRSDL